jgi:DTW domain-containing protein YfiP
MRKALVQSAPLVLVPPMTASPTLRRASCATCLRAQSACICGWVARVDSEVEVLVLLHPLEVANAKNSGRLLHLCLPNSRLVTGEAFDPAQLDALLHAGGRQPLLLYPPTAGAPAPCPDPRLLAVSARLRLVVLDATWRKSRKMLYQNQLLQALPRLALDEVPASAYRIRKAHAPHQLSTLEATAHALAKLDGNDDGAGRLLRAFDGFVAQQAAFARGA